MVAETSAIVPTEPTGEQSDFGGAEDIKRLEAMEKAVRSNMPIALLTAADREAARKRMREALYDLWQTDLWRLRTMRNGEGYKDFRSYAAERLKVTTSRISQLISAEHEDRLALIEANGEDDGSVNLLTPEQFSPRAGGTRGPRSVNAIDTAAVILRGGDHFAQDAGNRIRAISDDDADAVNVLEAAHKAYMVGWNAYRATLADFAARSEAEKARVAAEKDAEKAKRAEAKAQKDAEKIAKTLGKK